MLKSLRKNWSLIMNKDKIDMDCCSIFQHFILNYWEVLNQNRKLFDLIYQFNTSSSDICF
jgi:hypothetical protein